MTTLGESIGHPALTDPLTGVANSLCFDALFRIIFETGDRGIPLTILLLDLDDFSGFVAKHGEARGQDAVRAVGHLLNGVTRRTDLLARLEGDHFASLLVDCNLPGGLLVADRFQMTLEGIQKDTGLTCSMGIATYRKEMKTGQDLLTAAEEALAAAKAAGGNRIETSSYGL